MPGAYVVTLTFMLSIYDEYLQSSLTRYLLSRMTVTAQRHYSLGIGFAAFLSIGANLHANGLRGCNGQIRRVGWGV